MVGQVSSKVNGECREVAFSLQTPRMHTRSLITRASGKVRRLLADQFGRRMVSIKTPAPVSFTFDDAPITAFRAGRGILKQFGVRATYSVSLGLLDAETEVGKIASVGDLARASGRGQRAWMPHVRSFGSLAHVLNRVHDVSRPERRGAAPDLAGREIHDFRVSEKRGQAFTKVDVGK